MLCMGIDNLIQGVKASLVFRLDHMMNEFAEESGRDLALLPQPQIEREAEGQRVTAQRKTVFKRVWRVFRRKLKM